MKCQGCGYPQSQVVETKKDDAHGIVKRRRECMRCGLRFTTHEKLRDEKR